ncbi:MAG: formate dehydrogenase accessory sulfurtransferase FdhD, partial [Faecalibacterium sp.]
MQIMDQFGAAPGAESVRMPDGTERTLAAEHAAAILVNEQPAFRVVCTPELLPQLALGRLLTEGWINSADEVERVAVCAQGLKISVQLRHPLAAAEQAGQEVPSCCTDNLTLASPVRLPPLAPVPQREIPAAWVDALA